eukprot:scpid58333/ scgid20345/ 
MEEMEEDDVISIARNDVVARNDVIVVARNDDIVASAMIGDKGASTDRMNATPPPPHGADVAVGGAGGRASSQDGKVLGADSKHRQPMLHPQASQHCAGTPATVEGGNHATGRAEREDNGEEQASGDSDASMQQTDAGQHASEVHDANARTTMSDKSANGENPADAQAVSMEATDAPETPTDEAAAAGKDEAAEEYHNRLYRYKHTPAPGKPCLSSEQVFLDLLFTTVKLDDDSVIIQTDYEGALHIGLPILAENVRGTMTCAMKVKRRKRVTGRELVSQVIARLMRSVKGAYCVPILIPNRRPSGHVTVGLTGIAIKLDGHVQPFRTTLRLQQVGVIVGVTGERERRWTITAVHLAYEYKVGSGLFLDNRNPERVLWRAIHEIVPNNPAWTALKLEQGFTHDDFLRWRSSRQEAMRHSLYMLFDNMCDLHRLTNRSHPLPRTSDGEQWFLGAPLFQPECSLYYKHRRYNLGKWQMFSEDKVARQLAIIFQSAELLQYLRPLLRDVDLAAFFMVGFDCIEPTGPLGETRVFRFTVEFGERIGPDSNTHYLSVKQINMFIHPGIASWKPPVRLLVTWGSVTAPPQLSSAGQHASEQAERNADAMEEPMGEKTPKKFKNLSRMMTSDV